MKYLIGIIILIIYLSQTKLQADDNANFETWSDITTIYNLSDRWQYNGDQGIRGVLSGSDFTKLYARPSFLYQTQPWVIAHGGVGLFQTWSENDADNFELRPWQGLQFIWPTMRGYSVSHYFRLEQRMTWLTEQGSDDDFTLRSRYQLGAHSPDYDILFKNGIFLSGSIELFSDIENSFSNNFANQLRYDIGAGTKISRTWRTELHYVLQDGRAIQQDSFSREEHILRLRLFYYHRR